MGRTNRGGTGSSCRSPLWGWWETCGSLGGRRMQDGRARVAWVGRPRYASLITPGSKRLPKHLSPPMNDANALRTSKGRACPSIVEVAPHLHGREPVIVHLNAYPHDVPEARRYPTAAGASRYSSTVRHANAAPAPLARSAMSSAFAVSSEVRHGTPTSTDVRRI